jgi:hypothetical protein
MSVTNSTPGTRLEKQNELPVSRSWASWFETLSSLSVEFLPGLVYVGYFATGPRLTSFESMRTLLSHRANSGGRCRTREEWLGLEPWRPTC